MCVRGHIMIYFGFVLAMAIMGGTIYMVFDKKSDYLTRLASVIALGVMLLTVIICLFIALTNDTVPVDDSVIIVGAPVVTKKDISGNIMPLALSVILIIVFYVVIFFVSIKGQKKNTPKKKTETANTEKFEF
jgi:FtsH-binding integral membrane protein